MLGPQPMHPWVSAPNFGFGTASRDVQGKVFISQEHSALSGPESSCTPGPIYEQAITVGPKVAPSVEQQPLWAFGRDERFPPGNKDLLNTPGAKYEAPPSVGVQANSKKSTLPSIGFGSSTRDGQEKVYVSKDHNVALYGKATPGPTTALSQTNTAVGKQFVSHGPTGYNRTTLKCATQPSWALGKAERFPVGTAVPVPGPGAYRIQTAVGVQVVSTKPSLPKFGFGTSNRDHAAKVFVSKEHAATESGGRDAPGPGTYAMKSMTGYQQPSSKMRTGRSTGFGKGPERFKDLAKDMSPGPGYYII